MSQKVNARKFPIRDMVLKAWGKEWAKPEIVYEFSNNRKFESTDLTTSGIYKKT